MDKNETFYFVIYKDSARESITVIDLAHCVAYERTEFPVVNDETFSTPEEAITHAKALAEKYGLGYIPFESRYDSAISEKMHLTLD